MVEVDAQGRALRRRLPEERPRVRDRLPVGEGARGEGEARPTVFLSRGWMSVGFPTSMVTAMAVFATESVCRCASRSSGQALPGPAVQFASWTKRNGKSPTPHARRQLRIVVSKSRA